MIRNFFTMNQTNHHEPVQRNLFVKSKKSMITFLDFLGIKKIFRTVSSYSLRGSWLIILLSIFSINLYAQPKDDSLAAQRYVKWIQQAIDEKNWHEAQTALSRASDFETVSSDISFLGALYYSKQIGRSNSPVVIVRCLDKALDTNRWIEYSENQALLFKADQLIVMREYRGALYCLDIIKSESAQMSADIAYLRLLTYRGMAAGFVPGYNSVQAQAQFRSLVLNMMDRFPRDSRPLRVFLEYARNKKPQLSEGSFTGSTKLPEGDINLLDLILRRLPFLLETDPELAWLACSFIRDTEEARRLLASYRSGGIPSIQNRDFFPHTGSIPAALNLGLLGDIEACEELFSGSRSYNNPLSVYFIPDGNPYIDIDIIKNVYNLLRSEEGRGYFTQKLLSFTGIIYCDDDNDGHFDNYAQYDSGILQMFEYDAQQKYASDFLVFMEDGIPNYAVIRVTGIGVIAHINWEHAAEASRYPYVEKIILGSPLSKPNEILKFGPAVYQYAPVSFITLGGSDKIQGLFFPVINNQYIDITYKSLISYCSSVTRQSREFSGAEEIFYLSNGIIMQSEEILNEKQISVTQFQRGLPVLQNVDLDLDGRMETKRRFRSPARNMESYELLEYRDLLESQESDWHGDGRFKTKEVYQSEGKVVYYFDTDGSGVWTQSETGNR